MRKEILNTLEQMENKLDRLCRELETLMKRWNGEGLPHGQPGTDGSSDKASQWVQRGIDSIMSYQAGGKRDE